MGGTEPAYSLVLEALRRGKHVVTANKNIIAEHGDVVFAEAARMNRFVGFRGTFVGCHSLLHDLGNRVKEGRITQITAILNGTCNYILSSMTEKQMDFSAALEEAQDKGFAEKDPSMDIDGIDTAQKLKILLGVTTNTRKVTEAFPVKGIRNISLQDVRYAAELGYRIKLLGLIQVRDSGIYAQVSPALVKSSSLLATAQREANAIEVVDEFGKTSGLIAPGAGRYPTAQAILKDIAEIVQGSGLPMPQTDQPVKLSNPDELSQRFYLCFTVADRPGVLAQISTVFWQFSISVAAVVQKESVLQESPGIVPLVMLLHPAPEKDVRAALEKIDGSPVVKAPTQALHIYD
ncbi:MAG: homoserine dehydrogenase, partial [Chloroflexota bacterium]